MYCKCGCGEKTKIPKWTNRRDGQIKGKPLDFIQGHNSKIANIHPNWKGGKVIRRGYVYIFKPDHPNCDINCYVLEHRLVCEKEIGRLLSEKEIVHHINGDKEDNRVENLIVFKNQKEHVKCHTEERAFKACGNKNYRWCHYCKSYDDIDNLHKHRNGKGYYHKNCTTKKKTVLTQ